MLARLMLGEWPSLSPLMLGGQEQIEYEAARLRALREAGEAVPAVVSLQPGYLVLAEGGQPLGRVLRDKTREAQAALLCWVAQDLARFHGRGLWHGGAQLRNHLLANGERDLVRIDFEEPLDRLMPLAARQVVDLYLLIHSTTALKGYSEAAMRALCGRMVRAYLDVRAPEPAALEYLERGRRVLGALETWGGWFARPVSKDARRLFVTSAVLAEVVPQGGV
ncbi:serine/threonine protein phosphatase [Thioalkalivibrio sp. K90mix]|uniref:serine/threonine protein phosphatase n=1 Tax=Thioalkalivibrio sp. (strain K90mix) TaxID=396595 RepID=UPI0002D454E3|nr:serine/threonine protein phosphatase [Thioalkalivibrio sp. K90mix]